MAYLTIFLGGMAWGVIFESVTAAPQRGFYIIPAIIMAVTFAWSPFRLIIENICMSVLCGIITFTIISFVLTRGITPSVLFFAHGGVFVILSELLLYGIRKQTLPRHRY